MTSLGHNELMLVGAKLTWGYTKTVEILIWAVLDPYIDSEGPKQTDHSQTGVRQGQAYPLYYQVFFFFLGNIKYLGISYHFSTLR